MGEIQGNLWASLVFIVAFGAFSALILFALGIMQYSSQVKVIEDNISIGNYQYYKELPLVFNPCDTEPVATTEACTGIVEINEADGYVKYQVQYNGTLYQAQATSSQDIKVMLPY